MFDGMVTGSPGIVSVVRWECFSIVRQGVKRMAQSGALVWRTAVSKRHTLPHFFKGSHYILHALHVVNVCRIHLKKHHLFVLCV